MQLSKKEPLWFFILATLILCLGSLPTWVGQAAQTDELRFRGIYFDAQDYAVHISMMQAGRNGDWAYQMRFTSEQHQAALIKMFYILLGHVSRWIGLGPEVVYHMARWLLGYLALFTIYILCQRVFPDPTQARYAYLLAALGSGLGWLQLLLGVPLKPISPIDFWLIDVYVFFSLSIFPHFAFQLALVVGALILYLDYLNSSAWPKLLWIGLMAAAAQLINPIAFATVDLAFVGATLFHWWSNRKIEKKSILALSALALLQLPLLSYNFFVLVRDPVWSQFTTQNQTLSPPPSFYFWGLALFWPFAILGALRALKTHSPAWGALLAWVLGGFIFAYIPINIQRRFLLGITIPLGLLSVYGLREIINYFETGLSVAPLINERLQRLAPRRNLIYLAYILIASVSSMYLSFGSSLYMQTHPDEYYYPAELEDALAWLDLHATQDEFVLGDENTGELIGQYTDLKVYIGHEMETLHFTNKQAIVTAFYRSSAPSDWLEQTPIHWVIYGPYEKSLSSDFQPDDSLHTIYQNESVRIYEVSSR